MNTPLPTHISASSGRKPSILHTIGNTPVVRLNNIGPRHVNLFVKLEAFNPMGSVKDRMALAVIETAERSGELKSGQTVIEATSGNTGIGLAMVCAQKGYPLVIVMPENFSLERRKLLRFLGAKVVLTPAAERGTGMVRLAEALARAHGWFLCRQFENEANADIHSDTTAVEILQDFHDQQLDYWVTGFGTGGTLKGTARTLRRNSPNTKIIVAEPENSQLLSSGITQLRNADGTAARSHPNSRAHPIQGWSPDFIPKLAGDAVDAGCIDQIQPVSGADALQTARNLACREGIFCGVSGGATVAAALAVANGSADGANILAMIPDTGERYLTTPLFDHVQIEMSDEESQIASSVTLPKRKKNNSATTSAAPINPDAVNFVEDMINNPQSPVVMFGFEWCEFCWSVRRLFDQADISFKAIDVDSMDYRINDWGGDVLRALFDRTGMRTVPQIFVGGSLIGGASDVLASFGIGTLQNLLADLPKPIQAKPVDDPMQFLPIWVKKPASTKSATLKLVKNDRQRDLPQE